MRLAGGSPKKQSQNVLIALLTSIRARILRLILYSLVITIGLPLVVLEPLARYLRLVTQSLSVLLRLVLRALSLVISSLVRSQARALRSLISSQSSIVRIVVVQAARVVLTFLSSLKRGYSIGIQRYLLSLYLVYFLSRAPITILYSYSIYIVSIYL